MFFLPLVAAIVLQVPCIPGVTCDPPPCVPVLTCPPPDLPIPGDTPPELPSAPTAPGGVVISRHVTSVVIDWEAARDDNGIVGYRLYRDGKLRAITGPKARSARFAMPCGRHSFGVEAVDTEGQRVRRSISLRRPCL